MALASLRPLDPRVHRIVPATASIRKIAGGFVFTEGPVWTREAELLFSDIPENTIYRWGPGHGVEIFRKPGGYDGGDAPHGAFIGPNGLTLDAQGRLCICEHGNRRVTRLEAAGALTVLCSHYLGKRFNSPNDLIWHTSGDLYFTDPPYGLVRQDADPAKELDFNGVFRLASSGEVTLLHQEMTRPNGLVFSTDEKCLYVANSDARRKIWNRFPVQSGGTLSAPELFADATSSEEPGLPDGMKVDREDHLYCTGPGGVWIFTADARPLGVIGFPEIPANLHWGGAEGRTLYVTARTSVYAVDLNVPGVRP